MKNTIQILVASSNQRKRKELISMLKPMGIKVVTPEGLGGIPEIKETGKTFEENATLKAVQIAKLKKIHVFADDSGLEVEALDNRPGVLSARYAGPNASDRDRIKKLLSEMEGKTNRKARFVSVVAIADPNGEVKTFRGEVRGQIINEPRGSFGFGYDPIFVPDGYTKTFAELPEELKNQISHRANAIKLACKFLGELL